MSFDLLRVYLEGEGGEGRGPLVFGVLPLLVLGERGIKISGQDIGGCYIGFKGTLRTALRSRSFVRLLRVTAFIIASYFC